MTHDRTGVDAAAGSGGASYGATPTVRSVRSTSFFRFSKDGVNWGAVWGGLLTAIGLFVLLSVLAAAIGITAAGGDPNADPATAGRIGGVVSAILGLLAFFAGGYVAGRMSGSDDHAVGALNGFLVWALALVLIVLLAGLGAGAAFGTLAQNFAPATAEIDPNAAAEGARTAAWIAFISLALAATAATLGGWLGAATDDDDHVHVNR